MKSILLPCCLFAWTTGLHAQDTAQAADSRPVPAFPPPVTDTTATGASLPRLIDPVAAPATGAAPAPATTPYRPAPGDRLEATVVEQDGRRITHQRIAPLPVPPPPEPAAPPTAAERAAFAARAKPTCFWAARSIFPTAGRPAPSAGCGPPRAENRLPSGPISTCVRFRAWAASPAPTAPATSPS